jgi:predicted secreted protein
MGWTLGIATYFVIWWISLFAVLPFGVKSQHETGEVVPGSESGAPAEPMLLKKVIANTVLAAVIWLISDFLYIHFYLHS